MREGGITTLETLVSSGEVSVKTGRPKLARLFHSVWFARSRVPTQKKKKGLNSYSYQKAKSTFIERPLVSGAISFNPHNSPMRNCPLLISCES